MDPISLMLASGGGAMTGSPVTAGDPASGFGNVSFGSVVYGGKGNTASSATLPTPNSIFSPAAGIDGSLQTVAMIVAAGLVLLLVWKKVK